MVLPLFNGWGNRSPGLAFHLLGPDLSWEGSGHRYTHSSHFSSLQERKAQQWSAMQSRRLLGGGGREGATADSRARQPVPQVAVGLMGELGLRDARSPQWLGGLDSDLGWSERRRASGGQGSAASAETEAGRPPNPNSPSRPLTTKQKVCSERLGKRPRRQPGSPDASAVSAQARVWPLSGRWASWSLAASQRGCAGPCPRGGGGPETVRNSVQVAQRARGRRLSCRPDRRPSCQPWVWTTKSDLALLSFPFFLCKTE